MIHCYVVAGFSYSKFGNLDILFNLIPLHFEAFYCISMHCEHTTFILLFVEKNKFIVMLFLALWLLYSKNCLFIYSETYSFLLKIFFGLFATFNSRFLFWSQVLSEFVSMYNSLQNNWSEWIISNHFYFL